MKKSLKRGFYLFYLDFQHRARLNLLGYLWSVLRPTAPALPIIFVGSNLEMGQRHTDVPYMIFVLAGTLFWSLFSEVITSSIMFARRYRKTGAAFELDPASILIASCSNALFGFLLSFIPITAYAIYLKQSSVSASLLALASVPIVLVAASAFGILASALTLVYYDVGQGISYLLTLLSWSIPIYYLPEPGTILAGLTDLNPLTGLILTSRNLFFESGIEWIPLLISLALSILALWAGMAFFRYARRESIDYVI